MDIYRVYVVLQTFVTVLRIRTKSVFYVIVQKMYVVLVRTLRAKPDVRKTSSTVKHHVNIQADKNFRAQNQPKSVQKRIQCISATSLLN